MAEFNLTFLGTCACEPSPMLQNELKDKFDKDVRRTSAVLMNENFLIDSGMHILDSLRIAEKKLEEISNVFITHTHIDHFDAKNIAAIAKTKKAPLHLWVREDAKIEEIENTVINKMSPFKTYNITEELTVTGMPANHAPSAFPQHFIFSKNGKSLFYGCDGGWLLNETFLFLKNKQLTAAILDCTVGDYVGDFRMGEHNSIPMIRLMLPSLLTVKAITPDTTIYLSHLAPRLHKSHDETVNIAKEFGAFVAYDGLTVNI